MGDRPEATEKGRLTRSVRKLLSALYDEGGRNPVCQVSDRLQVVEEIDRRLTRDFQVLSGYPVSDIPYFQHRHIDGKDFYFVYNVARGGECFFRTHGAASLWNPWDGSRRPLPVQRVTEEGTVVAMPYAYSDVCLLCFDPSAQAQVAEPAPVRRVVESRALDGKWAFQVVPTLDNTYGDFLLPAFDGKVGPMVYQARYTNDAGRGPLPRTFTFGAKMLLLGAVPEVAPENLLSSLAREDSVVTVDGASYAWRPYEFSWRWGVERDYGFQGWHGLKARMYDDFIRLGKPVPNGNASEIQRLPEDNVQHNYYLFTRVLAPEEGLYAAEYGAMRPAALYLNGQKVEDAPALRLRKGVNELLLHFASHGTTRFVLRRAEPDIEPRTLAEAPLRMKFRGDRSLLLFDVRKEAATTGRYTFRSAPGLETLRFSSYGKPCVMAGDKEARVTAVETFADGLTAYRADLPGRLTESAEVTLEVDEPWGYADGSAVDGPIEQICGEGAIEIGDWSRTEGLAKYSGGAWYRYRLHLDAPLAGQVQLDLGRVVSTARLKVNGQEVGLRLAAPYVFDVTDCLRQGDNLVEVYVTNTSGNFYSTTPSRYCGSLESGILGPVRLQRLE